MRKTSQEREKSVFIIMLSFTLYSLYSVILSWFVDVKVANSAVASVLARIWNTMGTGPSKPKK